MKKLTLDNLPPEIEAWLNRRARERGNSLEEEIQDILKYVKANEEKNIGNLASNIQDLFVPLGGVDLPEIPREAIRDLPSFEEE
ncbi:FitA-like ribbon-helix-helix domain-containing protein [Dactylococcopsis salina]|uniref:Antitoxin FitA-like ribbon-helix-helix domain-containing protein n=1 Tax=Dactylococcopsis salina (strain PCC 8305) TaxID=13035 RepID=K9YTC1_DACS8|nr:hypothetical protein [Dactylococcopsis salina]AFZ50171.1 hypothetical protein Dacsa_1486 [Dactylococcopsis salina PCC 8305]